MKKITTMFAFVTADDDGNEGLIGFMAPGSDQWMPLVGADMDRVKDLIPIADAITRVTGETYRVLRFDTMTDITKEARLESIAADREKVSSKGGANGR